MFEKSNGKRQKDLDKKGKRKYNNDIIGENGFFVENEANITDTDSIWRVLWTKIQQSET